MAGTLVKINPLNLKDLTGENAYGHETAVSGQDKCHKYQIFTRHYYGDGQQNHNENSNPFSKTNYNQMFTLRSSTKIQPFKHTKLPENTTNTQ